MLKPNHMKLISVQDINSSFKDLTFNDKKVII